MVHDEGAGLLREVAEADCVCGLPPRLQLCFPLLSELVQRPSDSIPKVCRHTHDVLCAMAALHDSPTCYALAHHETMMVCIIFREELMARLPWASGMISGTAAGLWQVTC